MSSVRSLLRIVIFIGCFNPSFVFGQFGISDPSSLLNNVSVVRVSSTKQTLLDPNRVILEGDVDITLDTNLHIRADYVFLDQQEKKLTSYGLPGGALLLESPSFVLLADSFSFDLAKGEGQADNIRFHSQGRYISARKGLLSSSSKWLFEKVVYTACDHRVPHWSLTAHSASVRKNTIRAKNIFFRAKNIPLLWAPGIIIPSSYKASSPKSASSGFLIPRFSWDQRLGVGVAQEYYASFTRHLDSLFGVNWREKKGYMLYDRFRYARSPDDFTILNAQFAHELNAFIQKDNEVVKGHRSRYWLEGKNFQSFQRKGASGIDTLLSLDVGTDKRLEYEFFGKTDALEDRFYNSIIIRPYTRYNVGTFSIDSDVVSRERFAFEGEKKETKEYYSLFRGPHFEWSAIGFSIPQIDLACQTNIMVDYAVAKEKVDQKLFADSSISAANLLIPFEKEESFRLNFETRVSKGVNFFSNTITAYAAPLLQVRSHVTQQHVDSLRKNKFLSEGAYRFMVKTGVDWCLPEMRYEADSWTSYFNPRVSWDGIFPSFPERNWVLMDEHDYVYPLQQFEASVQHDLIFNGDYSCGWYAKQAYEINRPCRIFPLRRPVRDTHWLPLKVGAHSTFSWCSFETEHEFDALKADLLQSKTDFNIHYKRFKAGLSLIHQRPKLQEARELLSDIPSFAIVHLKVPLMQNFDALYQGHFYSPSNSLIGGIMDPRPSYHQVRIEYKGHCWSIMAGYEEKRFKQEGSVKKEQAFLFSFSLTSFGSFSKHFKKEPEILQAPTSYAPKL